MTLIQYSIMETFGQFTSYFMSCFFIAMYSGFCIYAARKSTHSLELVDGLKPESKFVVFFLLRRLLFGAVIVFINTSFFQLAALTFLSIASTAFIIKTKPFEATFTNRIETISEGMIIVITYHLLFFSNPSIGIHTRYKGGWSLDLLIIVQFLFYGGFAMYRRVAYLKLLWKRWRTPETVPIKPQPPIVTIKVPEIPLQCENYEEKVMV